MDAKVLIDTSVWITFFRGKDPAVIERTAVLLKSGRAVYTGIIALELLNGAKGQKELQILDDTFSAMQVLPVNEMTHIRAGRLGNGIARKGYTLGTVDLLIAQAAIESGVSLWTYDEHFSVIAEHSTLQLLK
ncbi:MAG: PIN domain-containing protein [Alphaproteobacteria bacterium]|uniref:Ribonuclease VapC n=1 Tax=Candidatus Nitrobium versatile TaxID=2884831 RepID=A0A953LZB9_9BACT|nr:PIN domain-containing protein [Candidatus Nitrobium versatile]